MGRTQDRRGGTVRLRLTPLEDRSLPTSGISASLNSGILRVTDWKAADNVVLRQTASGVTVDAIDTHQVYVGVGRVILDVQYSDSVTNDTSGLSGSPARSVYLSRRNQAGTAFISSGDLPAGATSNPPNTTPPPTTPPPPPPPSRDWFDTSLNDAGLRFLSRTVASDRTIDRIDMLKLFEQVTRDGIVSADEIHDLKAIERPDWTAGGTMANQAQFSMPDAVKGLASNVVDGDVANASYQGAALGNLQAGSSATQLQKLVNKWFLGLDHPQAASGSTYRQVSGMLFASGPAVSDVKQGAVGDCYLLAALGELAQDRTQSIRDMFTDNGDGTFTVRFFNNGAAEYATVDRFLPTNVAGTALYASFGGRYDSAANELWVALAEKAYAQLNQSGWTEQNGTNSYAGIADGYSDTVMTQVTGKLATWTAIARVTAADLIAAANSGQPTVLNSRTTSPGNNVVASHSYPVVGYDPTTQKFNLYNPQGSYIQLSWTQITQSFLGIWQST